MPRAACHPIAFGSPPLTGINTHLNALRLQRIADFTACRRRGPELISINTVPRLRAFDDTGFSPSATSFHMRRVRRHRDDDITCSAIAFAVESVSCGMTSLSLQDYDPDTTSEYPAFSKFLSWSTHDA